MGRCRSLNDLEKGQIIAYHGQGFGPRAIGGIIKRSHKVIINFLANITGYGTNWARNNARKFSQRDRRQIINIASNSSKSIHVSKNKNTGTLPWLSGKKIDVLDWPDRSPDLNIMENVWGILVQQVYGEGKQYDSEENLKTAILSAWKNLSLDTIRNLYNSLHERMMGVLENQGKHIDK